MKRGKKGAKHCESFIWVSVVPSQWSLVIPDTESWRDIKVLKSHVIKKPGHVFMHSFLIIGLHKQTHKPRSNILQHTTLHKCKSV